MVSLQFEDLKLQGKDGGSWESFFIQKGDSASLDKKLTFDLQLTELRFYALK